MRLVPLAAALLTAFSGAGVATASAAPTLHHAITPSGLPYASWKLDSDSAPTTFSQTWRRCTPDCGDAVTLSRTDMFDFGAPAAGSSFESTLTLDGVAQTGRTKTWQGTIANLTPPTISGSPEIGANVTAAGGAWSGGWGDERSFVGLRYCQGPEPGSRCVLVQRSTGAIDRAYAGWYVGAVDQRYAADPLPPYDGWDPQTPGIVSGTPAPTTSPTVVFSGLLGPITPLPVPQRSESRPEIWTLDFTPTVRIREHYKKLAKPRQRSVASLGCIRTCTVSASFEQKGRMTVDRSIRFSGKRDLLLPSKFSVRRAVSVAVGFDASPVTAYATVRPR